MTGLDLYCVLWAGSARPNKKRGKTDPAGYCLQFEQTLSE